MLKIALKILDKRIGHEFPLPQAATPSSAAMDLRACIDAPLIMEAGSCHLISAGIAIHVANPDYAAIILPRSGLGHKQGIVLGNLVGLIDADYQGPLMISCWNRSVEEFIIQPGDRIAQLLFIPIARATFEVVDAFDDSVRGIGGFGHTGTR